MPTIVRLLVLDTGHEGHRSNYFNTFVTAAGEGHGPKEIVFALSEELFQRLDPQPAAALKEGQGVRSRILRDAELEGIRQSRSEFARNLARWRLAMEIAKEVGASHIHFPLVDDVMQAALLFPTTPYTISGIYFRPSSHFSENWRGPLRSIRQAGKLILLKRFLCRNDVGALLVFDPFFTAFMAGQPNGHKVHTIPEPIDPVDVALSDDDKARSDNARGDNARFIFFGALQARKGVRELLDALALLKKETLGKTDFVITGEGELSGLVRERIPALVAEGVSLRFEERFLPQAELDKKLSEADAILAPYRNHVGSSGALYIAAAYRKPVITQNTGLVGRQVQQYRLGEAINTADPESIAQAIQRVADAVLSGKGMINRMGDAFIAGQGRMPFARAVYAHLG